MCCFYILQNRRFCSRQHIRTCTHHNVHQNVVKNVRMIFIFRINWVERVNVRVYTSILLVNVNLQQLKADVSWNKGSFKIYKQENQALICFLLCQYNILWNTSKKKRKYTFIYNSSRSMHSFQSKLWCLIQYIKWILPQWIWK